MPLFPSEAKPAILLRSGTFDQYSTLDIYLGKHDKKYEVQVSNSSFLCNNEIIPKST